MTQPALTSSQPNGTGRARGRPHGLPFGLHLYRLAMRVIGPLVPFILRRRLRAGKEDADRLRERLGVASLARPDGPLVWVHGVSVGESLMLLGLIKALHAEAPRATILMTTGTVTSARLMARRLPPDVIHQYIPVDRQDAVARFFDHWRPDLGVIAESELWPNLILEAEARGAPLALVNARMTERSLARWKRRPGVIRRLLSAFSVIAAADTRTAEGLSALRGADVRRLGNLKHAGDPPAANAAALASFRETVGPRGRIWLAASTHPGEDEIALDAHAALRDATPDALLILAPRHPERGEAVAALSAERGFLTARRSTAEPLDQRAAVYVADTLGEMGLWLTVADAALIAGSFAPGVGGHTPLEAAQLQTPILVGPHVANFDDLYRELESVDALWRVSDAAELAQRLSDLTPADAEARARAAAAVADQGERVLDAYLDALRPLIPAAPPELLALETLTGAAIAAAGTQMETEPQHVART